MINLALTSLRKTARWDNKLKQKYGLFDKFSLGETGVCEVANNPHILLTRKNQHIQ